MSGAPGKRLSVILITKNEAASIRACLESVSFADEIVVLDSGSTDGTATLCREFTDRVYETDWPGFGPQKNRALDRSTGDWILSIDADERVTPALRAEIEAAVAVPGDNTAFRIPRFSRYCGKYIRWSGWRPDYVLRLFQREKGRFTNDLVHERVVTDGPVGTLKESLLHESFENLEDVLDKVNVYSTYGAAMMHRRGQRAGLWTALGHGFWSFFSTYVLRAGFLDGREGFMLAVSNAEGTYYRYLKLMLLGERK